MGEACQDVSKPSSPAVDSRRPYLRAPSWRSRARLVDVASEAGVSKALASRVLNGEALAIRPETRGRILAAAENLNYQPHAAARSLKQGTTGVLALLVPTLANPIFALISAGAVSRALEQDVAVLLVEDSEPTKTNDLVRRLIQARRIDGLIMSSAEPEHPLLMTLKKTRTPHVFAHRTVPDTNRNVAMTDEESSALAVDYLASLGHRRIAYIAGPTFLTTTKRLADGFTARTEELDLADATVVYDAFTTAGGVAAAKDLLLGPCPPTAICTASVTQALGVLQVAAQTGLSIPGDLSLVAIGDLPLAAFLVPPLTAIELPFSELGAAAVEALISQLKGSKPRDVVIPVKPSVVIRASAAPPGMPGPPWDYVVVP
jgi:LacI family transcriptional regulator